MKKRLLLPFLAFLSFINLNAQVPNGGFENWTNAGTYEDPTDWFSLNFLALLGVPATTVKSTTAHGGTYSCENQCVEFTNLMLQLDTLCGITTGQFPFTQRPLNIEGWYQLDGSGTDLGAYLIVALTKLDTATMNTDTIASGAYSTPTPTGATWTFFNLPLVYASGADPDSALIFFGVSGNPASFMRMDDLAFNGTPGSAQNPVSFHFKSWPSPSNEFLNINMDRRSEWSTEIISLEGKTLESTHWNGVETSISTSQISPGLYFLKVRDNNTGEETCKKIQVLH